MYFPSVCLSFSLLVLTQHVVLHPLPEQLSPFLFLRGRGSFCPDLFQLGWGEQTGTSDPGTVLKTSLLKEVLQTVPSSLLPEFFCRVREETVQSI